MRNQLLCIIIGLLIGLIVMHWGNASRPLVNYCLAAADFLGEDFLPEQELDLDKRGMKQASELLRKGDVKGCRRKIAEYFLAREPRGGLEPWPAHANPIQRAEALLNNNYLLGKYEAYELPQNLNWKENPSGLSNWGFLLLAFDFLRDVNEAYRITGDERFLIKGKELIIDFAEDNYEAGLLPGNYSWYDHSVAYRAIFCIDFWHQWLKLEKEDKDFTLLLLELIWRHARYLTSDEYYSKKTNHGMFSNIALLRLSLAFPEFRQSKDWKNMAVSRMEQQVRDNFSVGGVQKEYSPGYHILTAKLLTRFQKDCRADRKIEFSKDFRSRLNKIMMYIPYLFHPDGTISLIGDTQKSRAEQMLKPLASVNSFIKYVQTDGKQGSAPRRSSAAFPDAKMFIMRSGWGQNRPYAEESYLIADFTEYGAAHQHLDFMTFELYSRGFRWITDLGPLSYNHNDPRRQFLISSTAHNVVVPCLDIRSFSGWQNRKLPKDSLSAENWLKMKRVKTKLKQIVNIKSVEGRITAYEKLLADSIGEMRDKILILLAFCYQETEEDSGKAAAYLREIINRGQKGKYYEVAEEMLSTGGINDVHISAVDSINTIPKLHGKPAIIQTLVKASHADQQHKPVVDYWISEPGFDYLEGHFTYNKLLDHSRAILFIKPYFFLILDGMQTYSSCTLKQLFHMPPDVEVSERDDGFLLSVGDSLRCLLLHLSSPRNANARVVKGVTVPEYQGWYSGIFGDFEEAPVIENFFRAQRDRYYWAHLFVPVGRGNIDDCDIKMLNGKSWSVERGKPLNLVIREPGYRTTVTFSPSTEFLSLPKFSSPRKPVVRVSRRRN